MMDETQAVEFFSEEFGIKFDTDYYDGFLTLISIKPVAERYIAIQHGDGLGDVPQPENASVTVMDREGNYIDHMMW